MSLMILSLEKIEQFSNQYTKGKVLFELIKNTVIKAHEGLEV
jgi:hypothetical protein